jgi:3-phenylpropionate/trans-cinnamate dioxygenase ferredoxin reductase subunit
MARHPDVVVVGGGLAAQRVCETLRRLGHDGRVRVLCEEPHPPYDRPPLSKGVLTGELDTATPVLRPPDWYLANEVELLLGARARSVDPASRRVELQDGSSLPYDELVIATGSRPRRLPALPLGEAVRELRTIDDARSLREALSSGIERLVIVGAGLIGMEVASSAVSLGLDVTLVEAAPTPLARVLPAALGRWITRLQTRAGVEVWLERSVEHLRWRPSGAELTLSDGRTLAADLVLVATGTQPAARLLAAAGLDGGALEVDAGGRSALPHVYAAGDAACFPDPVSGRHIPTPHWEAAAHQGAAVAHSIVGVPAKAVQPPMFWSDQHGVRIQFVGHAGDADRLELDGDPESGDFTAWLMAGRRPLGALLVGRPRALPAARARIAAGGAPDDPQPDAPELAAAV